MSMRFKLPPGGDCPPIAAARRIWLSLEEFKAKLPELRQRGFPTPDETTGNYDLDAIDVWRKARYPHLFADRLTLAPTARNAKDVVADRVARIRGG